MPYTLRGFSPHAIFMLLHRNGSPALRVWLRPARLKGGSSNLLLGLLSFVGRSLIANAWPALHVSVGTRFEIKGGRTAYHSSGSLNPEE